MSAGAQGPAAWAPRDQPPPHVTHLIWWENSCVYARGNATQNPGLAGMISNAQQGAGVGGGDGHTALQESRQRQERTRCARVGS